MWDGAALEFAHHFWYILLFEASHEASTASREQRDVMHLSVRRTAMIVCTGAKIQRHMIHYYNNLPQRTRWKGKIGAGIGVGNILYEWSLKPAPRQCCLKEDLKEVREPDIRVSGWAIQAEGTASSKALRKGLPDLAGWYCQSSVNHGCKGKTIYLKWKLEGSKSLWLIGETPS